MGFGITIHAKSKNFKTFQKTVNKLATESSYEIACDDSRAIVQFCKMGTLYLTYERSKGIFRDSISISGYCQTNLLGPGFHKAVVDFIDNLQKDTDNSMDIEDDTEYYSERDFEKLKTQHFHKWLYNTLELLHKQETKGAHAQSLCWDSSQYDPPAEKGVVISPLGSFRIADIVSQIKNEGIASFANEFFIWNNPEQDARFHRGSALHAMWVDCYFMPSLRSEEDAHINGYIIGELEKAASLDPSLPFPQKEYKELCQLHGCTPIATDNIPIYRNEFVIGYRRNEVIYKVGNVQFNMHGNYLKSMDEGSIVFHDDLAQDWHTIRCVAYSTDDEFQYQMDGKMISDGVFDNGKYYLYDMGLTQDAEDEAPYITYSCHVLSKNQFTLFTICASTQEGTETISKMITTSLRTENI